MSVLGFVTLDPNVITYRESGNVLLTLQNALEPTQQPERWRPHSLLSGRRRARSCANAVDPDHAAWWCPPHPQTLSKTALRRPYRCSWPKLPGSVVFLPNCRGGSGPVPPRAARRSHRFPISNPLDHLSMAETKREGSRCTSDAAERLLRGWLPPTFRDNLAPQKHFPTATVKPLILSDVGYR